MPPFLDTAARALSTCAVRRVTIRASAASAESLTARMTSRMADIAAEVMSVEHPFVFSDAHIRVAEDETTPEGVF